MTELFIAAVDEEHFAAWAMGVANLYYSSMRQHYTVCRTSSALSDRPKLAEVAPFTWYCTVREENVEGNTVNSKLPQ